MAAVVSDRRRYELYFGTFPNSAWSFADIKNCFHQILGRDSIVDCNFRPCGGERKQNHHFAILTFQSIDDVDQCMLKAEEIRLEHRVIIKRNLQDLPKSQRSLTQYVYISIKESDPLFTQENASDYFGAYGKILQSHSYDNKRKLLLGFDHSDPVDRILLDQPHLLHQQHLIIEKCFDQPPPLLPPSQTPPQKASTASSDELLRLQKEMQSMKESSESRIELLKIELNKKVAEKRAEQVAMMEAFLRLRCDERELTEKIAESKRMRDAIQNKIRLMHAKNERLRRDHK